MSKDQIYTSSLTRAHEATEALPPPVLVDTSSAFAQMVAALSKEPRIALDTESDSLYRYFYKVCLIQISTPHVDYIVDPLRLSDLTPLGAILADPSVEKVFHAAENDILVLKRDFDFQFAAIFDTMLAARILGWRHVGLAAMLHEQYGVTLDKRVQLTDWGQRPLTLEQLSYARLDSHYLPSLRDLLAQQLHDRRRWHETQEAFAVLPEVNHVQRVFDPDGFWRQKGARDLLPTALAVLRELYMWRDEQARAIDRPPFKVLGDHDLIHLSQTQPQQLTDLRLSPSQINRYGQAILSVIAQGRTAPVPQPPTRTRDEIQKPDPMTLACFDRLRAWRATRASERGVESDVIFNNATLMTIARIRPTSLEELTTLKLIGSWKIGEYGRDILRVLAEA